MANRRDANCACHCDARKYTHDPTNNASLICWQTAVYGFGVADGVYFSDLRSPEQTGGQNRKCERRSNGPKRWPRTPNPRPRTSIQRDSVGGLGTFLFFFKNRFFSVCRRVPLNTALISRESMWYSVKDTTTEAMLKAFHAYHNVSTYHGHMACFVGTAWTNCLSQNVPTRARVSQTNDPQTFISTPETNIN